MPLMRSAPDLPAQQHGDHHLGIERLIPAAISVLRLVQHPQIQRGHRVRDKERQMALGKPIARTRGKQQRLVRRAWTESRRHAVS